MMGPICNEISFVSSGCVDTIFCFIKPNGGSTPSESVITQTLYSYLHTKSIGDASGDCAESKEIKIVTIGNSVFVKKVFWLTVRLTLPD